MKNIVLVVIFITQVNFAQIKFPVGEFEINNDGVHNTILNSGNVAKMDMGFDGVKGFVKFGAHTGNGHRENILYMRGSDGNVGIGTDNPFYKLDVKGTIYSDKLYVGKFDITNDGVYNTTISSGAVARIYMGFDDTKGYIQFGAHTGSGQRDDILYLRGSDGNVGIGTLNPSALLDIYSPLPIVGSYDVQKWSTRNAEYNLRLRTIWNQNGINQGFIQRFNGVDYKSLIFYGGNVGIGTDTPDSQLAVKGTIHAQEVKVDLTGWSDFVFKKEYALPTLEEVEKHIAEKGHLENIPNEEEVLKNGINLGEMNAKLLQKIEEMTLYMIEMKKENQKMKKDITELKLKQKK